MIIYPAKKEDVAEICALVNSAYRGDSSRKGWTTEADLLDGIRVNEETLLQQVEEDSSMILIYKNDDRKLTGCVYLKKQDDHLYLGMLTVDPELQGKGTGKLLLEASEEEAKNWGCKSIKMTVLSQRTELINWYKKNGYKETGATEPFPTDSKFGIAKVPLEFIVMEKLV